MFLRVFASVAAIAFASAAAAAPPPPVSFGRMPAIESPSLSPDGKMVAFLGGPVDNRTLNIATIDQPTPVVMPLGNVRATGVHWVGNDNVIVRVTKYAKTSYNKYSYNVTRDFIFDKSGTLKTWLLNNSPESSLSPDLPIYKIMHGDKPSVLVQGLDQAAAAGQGGDGNTRFSSSGGDIGVAIYKVDVPSGKGVPVDRSSAFDWVFDHTGEARGKIVVVNTSNATIRPDEVAITVYGRGKGKSGWHAFSTVRKRGFALLGYSAKEDALYWSEEDGPSGVARIHKANLADDTVSIIDPPAGEGELSMIFDPDTDEPLAFTRTSDATRVSWLDPKFSSLYGMLGRAFKGKTISISDWSLDKSRFLVRVSSPDEPATWYLVDPGRKEVSPVGDEYPELKGAALGKKTYVSYSARDGMKIPAYVHMPPGGTGKNLPLIVLPHGGPSARDDDDFDWWAQFLASRGYVVLQPQFRGSTGYGYDFYRAGRQEWGGKMQDDVVDGVKYLAAQGTIDPKRVCIVGASYGGYAALENMTLNPDVFKCAVSVNGISDPGQMVVQLHRLFGVDNSDLLETFGDNRSEVANTSPMGHIANIKGPILLIYSAYDTTVPPDQSKVMQEHLKQAGRTSTLVELPGVDHYLETSASRTQMLTEVDSFLAKNLPVTP